MDTQTVILPALHRNQIEVQSHSARFKVVCAGRRWGKGVLGIGESCRRASIGKKVWWICPSFASAAYQAGWSMLNYYARQIPGTQLHLQRRGLMFPAGGFVQFKTAEEPDSLRGESIDFAVIDEAAHITELRELWELCLRPCLMDRKGDAWFISTPKGFNYFNELFKRCNAEAMWASFQFPSASNPHLDPQEIESIAKDMPALVKRQEIDAEFVQLAGAMFRREDIRIIEHCPRFLRQCRSWDLAWTQKTTSDFTAGARMGQAEDGTIILTDVEHGRWEWPAAIKRIADVGREDGELVSIGVEVVGAQAGALQTLMADPALLGFYINPIEVHKDKITRALPLMARAEQGKFAILRGYWNKSFLDELLAFPEGDHDDQVDAVTGGFTVLSTMEGLATADGIHISEGWRHSRPRFVPRKFASV